MTALHRAVTRFEPDTRDFLDNLAERASIVLKRPVSRSAVVRAAVSDWVAARANADPAHVIEAIRASMVSRGRKRQ